MNKNAQELYAGFKTCLTHKNFGEGPRGVIVSEQEVRRYIEGVCKWHQTCVQCNARMGQGRRVCMDYAWVGGWMDTWMDAQQQQRHGCICKGSGVLLCAIVVASHPALASPFVSICFGWSSSRLFKRQLTNQRMDTGLMIRRDTGNTLPRVLGGGSGHRRIWQDGRRRAQGSRVPPST